MPNKTLDVILNILKKGTGGEATEKELSGVEKAAKTAGKAILTYVSVESVKATYELAKMGAQSLRTKASFDAISGGSADAAANLEAMQQATRGALSEQSAMESANQLLSMGLATNAEELGNVTEMAVRLGGAMGGTASESIESFSLLLANQSIPRLDTFGISASNVRTRIKELQAATPGLSREMAFMAAVTEEGTISMERLGPATDDLALSFERTEAKAADLTAELSERLAPAVSAVLDTGMLLLTWNEQIAEAQEDHATEIFNLTDSYTDYEVEMRKAADAAGMTVDESGDLVRVTRHQYGAVSELIQANYLLSESMFDVSRGMTDASGADAILSQGMQDASVSANRLAESIGQASTPMERAAAEAARTNEAMRRAAGGMAELSTAASTVAGSFGELEFDNESLWDMAVASGASVEALGQLATQLGIATDAEIQASLGGFQLTEQFGAGLISADEYATGMANVQNEMFAASIATTDMVSDIDSLGSSVGVVTGVTDGLIQPVEQLTGGLDSAGAAIVEMRESADHLTGANWEPLRKASGIMGTLGGDAETSGTALDSAATAAGLVETGLLNIVGTGDEATEILDSLGGVSGDTDEALFDLIETAKNGQTDIGNLVVEFEELERPTIAVGIGLREASGGMRGISTNAPGAADGLDDIGSSAGVAAGGVDSLASGLGTTEAALAAIVAGSPWNFSVSGWTGSLPPEEDVATFGVPGARGAARVDKRQYSNATTITNIITDPLAAQISINEQRALMNVRIRDAF